MLWSWTALFTEALPWESALLTTLLQVQDLMLRRLGRNGRCKGIRVTLLQLESSVLGSVSLHVERIGIRFLHQRMVLET